MTDGLTWVELLNEICDLEPGNLLMATQTINGEIELPIDGVRLAEAVEGKFGRNQLQPHDNSGLMIVERENWRVLIASN